ncbi:MAG TPA: hypothetical protein VMM18_17800 [Gemmatimonadaceae bacterium]|nr:hypothetical protein [Gemmatimonadaceae bacterium]
MSDPRGADRVVSGADLPDDSRGRRAAEAAPTVRSTDLEPYTGLRYLSKLFKVMAVLLFVLLVAEIVAGLVSAGGSAVPALLAQGSRLLVLAGILWGVGDLAMLMIDVGHDVRASRILLARQSAQLASGESDEAPRRISTGGIPG